MRHVLLKRVTQWVEVSEHKTEREAYIEADRIEDESGGTIQCRCVGKAMSQDPSETIDLDGIESSALFYERNIMSEILKAVSELNDEIYENNIEAQATYLYETNGLYESVTFWGMTIWCSESANSEDEDNYKETFRNNLKELVNPAIQ